MNEDITDHQDPIQQVIQNANQLLAGRGQKIGSEEQRQLRESVNDLRSRNERLRNHSTDRTHKVNFAMEDVERIERGFEDFDTWLRNAEHELEDIKKNVATDIKTLGTQVEHHQDFQDDVVMHSADLSLMNTSTQKFLDSTRVYKDFLAEFRQMVMSRQFLRSFMENADKDVIRATLNDLSNRYAKLKADCFDQGRKLQRIMELHRNYDDRVNNTNDWLQDAEQTMGDLMREPVSAETEPIRRQIKDLDNFKKEVSKHRKDIDGVDETGRKLCVEHPDVKSTIQATTGMENKESIGQEDINQTCLYIASWIKLRSLVFVQYVHFFIFNFDFWW